MVSVTIFDWDDPRYSPVFFFTSVELAKESFLLTWPDEVRFREDAKNGEIYVDINDGFYGIIYQRPVASLAQQLLTKYGEPPAWI